MLPPEIWNKILYFAFSAQAGLDTLENCRMVCREWNEIIKRNVWLSPSKEWGIITKRMIEEKWVPRNCQHGNRNSSEYKCKCRLCRCPGSPRSFPSDYMISHAKALGMRKTRQVLSCKNDYYLQKPEAFFLLV